MHTDPEYAALAYRKAIIEEVMTLLHHRFLPDASGMAPQRLVCQEVLQVDSSVPEVAFEQYLEVLAKQRIELEHEMRNFAFMRKDDPAPIQEVPPQTNQTSRGPRPRRKGTPRRTGG